MDVACVGALLGPFFPFLFFGGFFVVAIAYSVMRMKGIKDRMRSLAGELGLQYEDGGSWGYPGIRGQYRGRDAHVYFVVEGSGKHRRTYTVVKAGHKGKVGCKINLSLESFGTKIANAIGFKEIKVGLSEFDDKYYIRVGDEAEAKRVLNMEVQRAVMDAKFPLEIEENAVRVKEYGELGNDAIKARMESLISVAEKVDSV